MDVAGGEKDNSDQVSELIAKGAKVNAVDKRMSALHRAAAKGNSGSWGALDAGANVDAVDEDGERFWAAAMGNLDAAGAL